MSLSCWPQRLFPYSKELVSSLGYRWVEYRFGPECISFLDKLGVCLVLRICLFTVRGFCLLGCTSVEVIGLFYLGQWFRF